jgi:hypothetical protein
MAGKCGIMVTKYENLEHMPVSQGGARQARPSPSF